MSIVDWCDITTRENSKPILIMTVKKYSRVRYDYSLGNLVHVKMTYNWHKICYKKIILHRITVVFINGTINSQRGLIINQINTRQI